MSSELSLWIKKIIVLILILGCLYIGYRIWGIIFTVLISGFLTIVISPLVEKWEKHKIPAWVTLIGVYIAFLLLAVIVIGTLIPIVISYVTETINTIIAWANTAQGIYVTKGIQGFGLNPYVERVVILMFWENNIDHTLDIIKQNAGNIQSFLTKQISSLTSGGLTIVSSVGSAMTEWVMVGITTFLMVLERKSIAHYLITSFPPKSHKYIAKHYTQIQGVFNSWMRGMLILSASIAIITYIGLWLLEAVLGFSTGKTFTLAIIGGIMEFIPYVGPLIALIPAVIIGLGISWKVAFAITILYIVIQQIENNFLVPYIMSRSLDLSPFFVFVVMLIGAALGGILGIILAIPMAWVIRLVFEEYRKKSGSEGVSDESVSEKVLTKARKLIASKTPSEK